MMCGQYLRVEQHANRKYETASEYYQCNNEAFAFGGIIPPILSNDKQITNSTVTFFLTLWTTGRYNMNEGEEMSHAERRSLCRSWITPKPRHS
jgi:hypothetical protein